MPSGRGPFSVPPQWAASYSRGRDVLAIDPDVPPSYSFSAKAQNLAAKISDDLDRLVTTLRDVDPEAIEDLEEEPIPIGAIRRIPQI